MKKTNKKYQQNSDNPVGTGIEDSCILKKDGDNDAEKLFCVLEEDIDSIAIYTDMNEWLKKNPIDFTHNNLLQNYCLRIFDAFSSSYTNSIIIYGKPGEGRTTVVQELVQMIINKKCSQKYRDIQFIEFDSFLFPECANEIFSYFYKIISGLLKKGKKKLVFVFDNLSEFPIGFHENYIKLLEYLNKIKNLNFVKFISIMDKDEFSNFDELQDCDEYDFIKKSSLSFEIEQELLCDTVIKLLEPRIAELLDKHEVIKIEEDVLDIIYMMTNAKFDTDYCSYKRYLYSLDMLLITCQNAGSNTLTKAICVKYYNEQGNRLVDNGFDSSNMESQEIIDTKTVKHESAHTVLALYFPQIMYCYGVTVIPVNESEGDINFGMSFIRIDSSDYWKTKESVIQYLACYMAGVIGETESELDDAGLSGYADYTEAYTVAMSYLLSSGKSQSLGINITCVSENEIPDEKKILLDQEVSRMLEDAKCQAKIVLQEKKKFACELENALKKERILTRNQLIDLMNRFW